MLHLTSEKIVLRDFSNDDLESVQGLAGDRGQLQSGRPACPGPGETGLHVALPAPDPQGSRYLYRLVDNSSP